MSNRNFDNSVIIKRLQDKNYARNLYLNNTNGRTVINNPQTSDGTAGRYNMYIPGAQTEYFRGLLGGQEIVNIGGSIITPMSNQSLPTVSFSVVSVSAPNAPINLILDTSRTYASGAVPDIMINFIQNLNSSSQIINYKYSTDNGYTFREFSPPQTVSPIIISKTSLDGTNLIEGTQYTVRLKAVTINNESISSESINAIPTDTEFFNTGDTIIDSGTVLNTPNAPILVYAIPADNGIYIYFTADTGGGLIENYEYTYDDGLSQYELNPTDILSPVYIPGLINGTEYSIKLRAINNSNSSTWSNTIIVTPSNDTIPPAVLMFDPNNNSSYSGAGPNVVSIGTNNTVTGTKGSSVIYEDDITISRKIFNFSGSNGTANVIQFTTPFNFGTTISVTAWIYPRNKANINGLLANTTANVAPNGFKFQWNWWNNGSRTIGMQAGNGTQGADNYSVQNTINYGEWQHIGYVFDQANRKVVFFKNGIPIDMMTSIEPVVNIGTNQAFNIGGYIGGTYTMNANLGYIKIFNTLLNASEILDDFNSTKSQFGL
jgi:hypothetical protein